MDKRTQKRIKRDQLDLIMKEHPSLDKFLEALTADEKPEIYDIVKASVKDSLDKARMLGVKIGYISALLWVKNKIEREGVEKTMDDIQAKILHLSESVGVKNFYDMEAEDRME